jgi:hypothetical protein
MHYNFANIHKTLRITLAPGIIELLGRLRMDIREVKPIASQCVRCHGQANVLIEGWTPDGPTEKSQWTCPRCHAANAIMVPGKVVGVAIATGRVVSGASN